MQHINLSIKRPPTKEQIDRESAEAVEKAFAKRLQETKNKELLTNTMVKSAQMVIKDNDSVQMYFYADSEKKNEISK